VLKPGGELVGSAFVADGSRRQRFLFRRAGKRGSSPPLLSSGELASGLRDAGLVDVALEGRGFVVFGARKH
jgi:hypothetical protein